MQVYEQDMAPTKVLNDEKHLEEVFKQNFRRLYTYAFSIVKNEIIAEEMVQNVFLRIWEKRDTMNISTSATAYLYKSVYHESLNYLRHRKVQESFLSYASKSQQFYTAPADDKIQLSELQQELQQALNELPEQCRTIFQMSRFEELKYREIADRLGLSVKTVENQIGKALKILRNKLSDFLPLFILLFISK